MTQRDTELVGLGFHFEDLPLGRQFQTVGRTITETDIVCSSIRSA